MDELDGKIPLFGGRPATLASLVLRLDDVTTGFPARDGKLRVVSGDGLQRPVVKPDGYYVFTGRAPSAIRVSSELYQDAMIDAGGHAAAILRFALIPRDIRGACVAVPRACHVGFGEGYSAAFAQGGVILNKEDYRDVTNLYHAVVSAEAAAEAVFITKHGGQNQYALREPPKADYAGKRPRLVPLYPVLGGAIPVPPGVDKAYLYDGVLSLRQLNLAQN